MQLELIITFPDMLSWLSINCIVVHHISMRSLLHVKKDRNSWNRTMCCLFCPLSLLDKMSLLFSIVLKPEFLINMKNISSFYPTQIFELQSQELSPKSSIQINFLIKLYILTNVLNQFVILCVITLKNNELIYYCSYSIRVPL